MIYCIYKHYFREVSQALPNREELQADDAGQTIVNCLMWAFHNLDLHYIESESVEIDRTIPDVYMEHFADWYTLTCNVPGGVEAAFRQWQTESEMVGVPLKIVAYYHSIADYYRVPIGYPTFGQQAAVIGRLEDDKRLTCISPNVDYPRNKLERKVILATRFRRQGLNSPEDYQRMVDSFRGEQVAFEKFFRKGELK